jgi:phospholipid transport system substrate-binding protein
MIAGFNANGFLMRRPVAVAAAFALFVLSLVAPQPARAAGSATSAESFVQQNIDRGYAILNDDSIPDPQRRMQFRQFMLSLTDPRRIGLFTLGPYVRGASKAEIDSFVDAFTDYAVAMYESRLGKYKGQTIKVTGSQERSPDDIIVFADVIDSNQRSAQPIKAAFRVRTAGSGNWIVTDMQVEGVWLALSERSDFTGFLAQHNGSIPALTTDLERQAKEIGETG